MGEDGARSPASRFEQCWLGARRSCAGKKVSLQGILAATARLVEAKRGVKRSADASHS